MSTKTIADEKLDRIFHALADRTRRALLARLIRGPAKVTELAAPFDMSLPAVSKHLRVLEHAQLIRRQIDGRVHRCTLDAAALNNVETWLQSYQQFWQDSLESMAEYLEAEAPLKHNSKKKRR